LGTYGSGNRSWNSYRKVNEIKDSGNLSNTSALYWYATINSGIQEISNMISKASSSVFTDNNVLGDPAFFLKQMANVASKGLSDTDTAKSLDVLMRDCTDTKTGKKLDRSSSLKDIFDLTKPNCYQEWNTFQTNISRVTNNISNSFSPGVFQSFAKNGVSGAFVANYQVATAVKNYVDARAGYYDKGNATMNSEVTYSDKTDETWQNMQNPFPWSLKYLSNWIGGKDSFLQENKAEISTIFNKVVTYLPQLRAYTAGFLAILFIPVIMILGCGFPKFFIAWITSVSLLALYQPVSSMVYQIGRYVTSNNEFMKNSSAIANDPFMLIASKLIDSQISQILVVTMVGSIKFMGSAMSITGRFSDTGISAVSQGITALARMGMGKGMQTTQGAENPNINIHTHGPASSGAPQYSASNSSFSSDSSSSALSFKNPTSQSGSV
jgi:hypothetical protein